MKLQILIIVVISFFISFNSNAEWIPPANPDPQKIRSEGIKDRKSGRYELALQKHLWFHNNALNFGSKYAGVRLSYALNEWIELGKLYPPALNRLIEIRNELEIKTKEDQSAYRKFSDYLAINKALNETHKTVELYAWLDGNDHLKAVELFDLAKKTLARANKYEILGKHIEGLADYIEIKDKYRERVEDFTSWNAPKYATESNEMYFADEVIVLLYTLVKTNRIIEAEEIAAMALKETNISKYRVSINSALKGIVKFYIN